MPPNVYTIPVWYAGLSVHFKIKTVGQMSTPLDHGNHGFCPIQYIVAAYLPVPSCGKASNNNMLIGVFSHNMKDLKGGTQMSQCQMT